MTTEYTPGPYRAVPRDGDTIRVDVVTYGLPFAPSFVAGDMLPQDAALLVAAPDLLAALEETRDYFLDDLLTGDDGPKFRHALHTIEEACARARARGIGQNIDTRA